MPDFPLAQATPLHVSATSRYGCGPELRVAMSTGSPAAFTWTANQAIYIPVAIPWPYLVKRVWWYNGSTVTSSNADMGIYTPGGTKIYSQGSTAMSGTSAVQYANVSTPFVLDAGMYFFAWACNNSTSRAFGWAPTVPQGALCGILSQTTAFALPSPATFATYGAAGVPIFGVTRTASGF